VDYTRLAGRKKNGSRKEVMEETSKAIKKKEQIREHRKEK
jgi:hypothetical protein